MNRQGSSPNGGLSEDKAPVGVGKAKDGFVLFV